MAAQIAARRTSRDLDMGPLRFAGRRGGQNPPYARLVESLCHRWDSRCQGPFVGFRTVVGPNIRELYLTGMPDQWNDLRSARRGRLGHRSVVGGRATVSDRAGRSAVLHLCAWSPRPVTAASSPPSTGSTTGASCSAPSTPSSGPSRSAAASLVSAIAAAADAAGHHPDVDLRYPNIVHGPHDPCDRRRDGARRRAGPRDLLLAAAAVRRSPCAPVARDRHRHHGRRPHPALLGRSARLPRRGGYLVDPLRIGPPVWFQQMDEPRTDRDRFTSTCPSPTTRHRPASGRLWPPAAGSSPTGSPGRGGCSPTRTGTRRASARGRTAERARPRPRPRNTSCLAVGESCGRPPGPPDGYRRHGCRATGPSCGHSPERTGARRCDVRPGDP